jgi:hypothetical protein
VPAPPIPDDDGSASEGLVTQLAALEAGTGSGEAVLAALSEARLLVPVVAVLDDAGIDEAGLAHEKQSTMATVLVSDEQGGRALVAFTATSSMALWRSDARPVPLAAPLAARAALDEAADTLLVDVAGPVPFAIAGDELLLLAAMARHPSGVCEDPVVIESLRRHLVRMPQVRGAGLQPSDSGSSPAAVLTLSVRDDDDAWLEPLVARLAADRALAHLVPGGLRVRVGPEQPDTPNVLPITG